MSTSTSRWRLTWAAIVAVLIVLDLYREQIDTEAGRDYVSGTTFSCFCRWIVDLLPAGRTVFRGGLGWFHFWFDGHILEPD